MDSGLLRLVSFNMHNANLVVRVIKVPHPRKAEDVPVFEFKCTCRGYKFSKLCRHIKKVLKMVMPGASFWGQKAQARKQHKKVYPIRVNTRWFWITDRDHRRTEWCGWRSRK